MVMTPAPKPSRPPALRRPISSEKNENDSRPIKPNTESRIIILAASCGETFKSSTNSDGARPQRDAVNSGLRAGVAKPGDDQAARIFEEVEPVADYNRPGV